MRGNCFTFSGGGGGVVFQGGHTLENRENGEKKSLQGKIREFEILLKNRGT